jgi:hypothetical protein
MRACAGVALAPIAMSASISLSGCAAIEELKETFLRKRRPADVFTLGSLP